MLFFRQAIDLVEAVNLSSYSGEIDVWSISLLAV